MRQSSDPKTTSSRKAHPPGQPREWNMPSGRHITGIVRHCRGDAGGKLLLVEQYSAAGGKNVIEYPQVWRATVAGQESERWPPRPARNCPKEPATKRPR